MYHHLVLCYLSYLRYQCRQCIILHRHYIQVGKVCNLAYLRYRLCIHQLGKLYSRFYCSAIYLHNFMFGLIQGFRQMCGQAPRSYQYYFHNKSISCYTKQTHKDR